MSKLVLIEVDGKERSFRAVTCEAGGAGRINVEPVGWLHGRQRERLLACAMRHVGCSDTCRGMYTVGVWVVPTAVF